MSDNNKGNRKKRSEKSKKKSKDRNHAVRRRRDRTIKSVLDFLFFLVIISMLSGGFLFMISQKEDKTFLRYRLYNVLTNSMIKTENQQKGNFSAGDMIVVKSIDPKEVEVGDVITFIPNSESKDTYLTHRVIEKNYLESSSKDGEGSFHFITKGDANNNPDPEITSANIIGKKVLVLPKAGKMVEFVQANLVVSLIFIVSFCLLIIIVKGYVEEISRENNTRRKKHEKTKKK